MSILTTGDTWYDRYGFLPKHSMKYKIDKKMLEKYNENKKIVTNILVEDVGKLKKYIMKVINDKKYKQFLGNIDEKILLDSVDKYKHKSISWFLNEILADYDKGCYLFYLIYNKLFNKLKLNDFNGKGFIMML